MIISKDGLKADPDKEKVIQLRKGDKAFQEIKMLGANQPVLKYTVLR